MFWPEGFRQAAWFSLYSAIDGDNALALANCSRAQRAFFDWEGRLDRLVRTRS